MRALAAAVLGALVLPGAAFAHAQLVARQPPFGERLPSAPASIVLRFDQAVEALPGAIDVRSSTGRLETAGPVKASPERRVVSVPLRRLPKGAYTVRWHVTSLEGHPLSGVYTFGVRVVPPPPTKAYGAGGPTRGEDLVGWGYFLALALLVGGLAFRLLVVGKDPPPAVERRFYAVAGIGVVGALELGIVAFLLKARDAFQVPFGRLVYGDLSPLAEGTRFGTAFVVMTLGFGLVAALVFLAWLTDRVAFLWPAFVLSLGLCSGLSLSGHSATDTGASWRSELADWLHLSAACLWIGGLVQLAIVVWPLAPELRRRAFLGFSRLATVLVAVLVGAGVYLAYLRLPEASDLWEEHYGRVLLIKLSLVAIALGWGGLHRFVVRPLLERGAGDSPLLARSLLGESAVAMAVLLVAAVLVNSNPPERPSPQSKRVAAVSR